MTAVQTPHRATHGTWFRSRATWQLFVLYYVPLLAALNLVWEVLQLPLYTIWRDATAGEIAYAVAHCTAGDVGIGSGALLVALAVVRPGPPPTWSVARIGGLTTALAVAYTMYSEWLNTSVRQAWAYSELMPVLPVTGTGLSPLAQWLVIPTLALLLSSHLALPSDPRPSP